MKNYVILLLIAALFSVVNLSVKAQCCTKPDSLKVTSVTYFTDTTARVCISWKIRDTLSCDSPRTAIVQYKATTSATWIQRAVTYPAHVVYYSLCDTINIVPCTYYQFRIRNKCISNNGDTTFSAFAYSDSLKTRCTAIRKNSNGIKIVPNPVKDVLKISGLPANQKSTINIISRNGNVVQSSISNNSIFNINVSQLKSGVYTAQVITNGKTQTVKFVKE